MYGDFFIQIIIDIVKANTTVPDQTPHYTASDLGLHCMYICACLHPRVCMGINVPLRVGTCVHICMRVLVCVYLSV